MEDEGENSSRRSVEISSELISPGSQVPETMAKWLEPVRQGEAVWKEQVIGTLAREIPAQELLERAVNGCSLADLGNQVQLWITGADMACIGMANVPLGLGRQVKVGDMVLYHNYAGSDFKLDEKEVTVLKESDVLAIVEK